MYYLEMSAETPVAVRDRNTRERWWWNEFSREDQLHALDHMPRWDINRKRFVA